MAGAPHCPPGDCEFSSSDYVRVELDAEIFEMLQQNHGGWNSAMGKVCSKHLLVTCTGKHMSCLTLSIVAGDDVCWL